jgi:hypothetical protein
MACTYPYCAEKAFNRLGVRLRVMADGGSKPKTNAVFSRETGIWLCDEHSKQIDQVVCVAVLDKSIIKGEAIV